MIAICEDGKLSLAEGHALKTELPELTDREIELGAMVADEEFNERYRPYYPRG